MGESKDGGWVVPIIPEIVWGGFLFWVAANLRFSPWTDPVVLAETAILVAAAIWSVYRRLQESPAELFYSVLYMASTSVLLVIQNSSWTRFAVLIILAAYMYGRVFREKRREM